MSIYPTRTFLHKKLHEQPSAIHGAGIFADEVIVAGEKIMDFGGEYITRSDAYSGNYRSRTVWPITREMYIALPTSDTEPSLDEALNHSCDANTWLDSAYTLVARRDISAGEEITLDQGTWNFEDDAYTDNSVPCSCSASECRRVLTKSDWQRADVQEKYAHHFHPVVQGEIDAVRNTS
jgi:uncharacterized protein